MHRLFPLLVTLFTFDSFACAVAFRDPDHPFGISYEESVIFWDSQTRTEHFIRKARFENEGKNFGFIVPVPSVAEVADFRGDLPASFNAEMERQRPIENKYQFLSWQFLFPGFSSNDAVFGAIAAKPSVRGVSVAQEFSLASYDVKVIKSDGLAPLLTWLSENQFQTRPPLEEYLNHYVQKNWYFVVFNFRGNDQKKGAVTDFVRISFKTDGPFYPYMEARPGPATTAGPDAFGPQQSAPTRGLNLYLYSDVPLKPDFSGPGPTPEKWSSGPLFSGPISKLHALVNPTPGIQSPWLTVWVDKTNNRPARDISFIPGDKREVKLLSPIIQDIAIDEVIFFWGGALFLLVLIVSPRKLKIKLYGMLKVFCATLTGLLLNLKLYFILRILTNKLMPAVFLSHPVFAQVFAQGLSLAIFFIVFFRVLYLSKNKVSFPAWVRLPYLGLSFICTGIIWLLTWFSASEFI